MTSRAASSPDLRDAAALRPVSRLPCAPATPQPRGPLRPPRPLERRRLPVTPRHEHERASSTAASCGPMPRAHHLAPRRPATHARPHPRPRPVPSPLSKIPVPVPVPVPILFSPTTTAPSTVRGAPSRFKREQEQKSKFGTRNSEFRAATPPESALPPQLTPAPTPRPRPIPSPLSRIQIPVPVPVLFSPTTTAPSTVRGAPSRFKREQEQKSKFGTRDSEFRAATPPESALPPQLTPAPPRGRARCRGPPSESPHPRGLVSRLGPAKPARIPNSYPFTGESMCSMPHCVRSISRSA